MREVGPNELLPAGVLMESRVFLRSPVRDWVPFTLPVCMRLVTTTIGTVAAIVAVTVLSIVRTPVTTVI